MPGLTQHLHGLWYVSEYEYIDAKFSSTLVEYSIVRCRAMRRSSSSYIWTMELPRRCFPTSNIQQFEFVSRVS
jgi:hypothetical protein